MRGVEWMEEGRGQISSVRASGAGTRGATLVCLPQFQFIMLFITAYFPQKLDLVVFL